MAPQYSDAVFAMPAGASAVADHLGPRGKRLDLLGLNVMAQPPGLVDVSMRGMTAVLNVQLPGARREIQHTCRVNGGKATLSGPVGGNYNLFAPLDSLELSCTNYEWECLIEIDHQRVQTLLAEHLDGRSAFRDALFGGCDARLAHLALMTVEHLRAGPHDRLYVEGLSIAMTARAIALSVDRFDDVSLAGVEPRIGRAIDYIEAHLGSDLSVARIAAAAAMSPSWFQRAFNEATGQTVFAYVRERRLERARALLADPRLPLAEIAERAGFSDQSHMTRAFRARWGATPAAMRRG